MGGEELGAGALLDEDLEVGEALVFQKISEFEARFAFEVDPHGVLVNGKSFGRKRFESRPGKPAKS